MSGWPSRPSRVGAALLAVLGALALATACASRSIEEQVGVSRDDEVDFSEFRTFALAPSPEMPAGAVDPDAMDAGLRAAIAGGLAAKGLVPTGKDEADLHVHFDVGGDERVQVTGSSRGWTRSGGPLHITPFTKGRLTIDVMDRARSRLVWRGWATTELFREGQDARLAPKAARAILARYPGG